MRKLDLRGDRLAATAHAGCAIHCGREHADWSGLETTCSIMLWWPVGRGKQLVSTVQGRELRTGKPCGWAHKSFPWTRAPPKPATFRPGPLGFCCGEPGQGGLRAALQGAKVLLQLLLLLVPCGCHTKLPEIVWLFTLPPALHVPDVVSDTLFFSILPPPPASSSPSPDSSSSPSSLPPPLYPVLLLSVSSLSLFRPLAP